MEASILKDAIGKIEEMAYPHFFYDHNTGDLYYDCGSSCRAVEPPLHVADSLELNSLDALVQVVRTECRTKDDGVVWYVSVASPGRVEVYSTPQSGLRGQRRELCTAKAGDIPGFRDTTYEYEQAIIALRSRFAPSEDQGYVLNLMSHLVSEQTVATEDDGVTQRVQVSTGVQMTGVTRVKPIVKLRSYRTFQEVPQPESEFLIRLDDKRRLTITEADGGMWRLKARAAVCGYLIEALKDEIARGIVIVML